MMNLFCIGKRRSQELQRLQKSHDPASCQPSMAARSVARLVLLYRRPSPLLPKIEKEEKEKPLSLLLSCRPCTIAPEERKADLEMTGCTLLLILLVFLLLG
jgi:hypothetical protein